MGKKTSAAEAINALNARIMVSEVLLLATLKRLPLQSLDAVIKDFEEMGEFGEVMVMNTSAPDSYYEAVAGTRARWRSLLADQRLAIS